MTVPQTITSEIQKLEPSAIIELFEIDATSIGGDVLRFHAGTNGLRQSVVWQGNTYMPFPMQATGFDFTGNGQLPRPKLVMSNASGAMTLLVLTYEDLLGAKVTRRRTLAKYLDAVNFPARRNLIAPSVPNNTNWIVHSGSPGTPNFGIAPDGTQTTYKTNLAAPAVYRGGAITPGQVYTYSIFVKAAATDPILIYVDGMFGSGASFDVASAQTANLTTPFTLNSLASAASATYAGGGWYRLSLTFTPLGGSNANVFVFPITTNQQEWWGAQLEVGSVATPYQAVGTTWSQNPTADPAAEFPVDIFYIDRKASETRDLVEFELASSFDVAGVQLPRRQIIQNVCPWRYRGAECGWTTPPDRRNLLIRSQEFEPASGIWGYQHVTVTANTTTAPDGTTTADSINVSAGDPILQQTVYVTSSKTFTISVWLKGVGSSIGKQPRLFLVRDAYLEVIQGNQPALTGSWQRYSLTGTFASFPSSYVFHRFDVVDDTPVAGDVVYAWGAQLEIGSTLTDYQAIGASYTNPTYFDANDAAVGTLAQDVCGKRLSSCKARFGANNPLPFGSFPAAGLTR